MLNLETNIKEYVQKVAIPAKTYHFAKDPSGKLLNYSPKVGQIAILDNFESYGTVIKAPNFARDFLVELPSGARVRKNTVNKDIEGYIDV